MHLRGRASKSKLRRHDKVCLGMHFLDVCLCVGYKMQISDSGFRGEINVVSPGDSAKRASPGISPHVFLDFTSRLHGESQPYYPSWLA